MWFHGGKRSSGFSSNSIAEQVTHGIDGTGLTAIVTGASSGLGKETARVLALRGVHVVMAVRNVDSGRKVKDNILEEVATASSTPQVVASLSANPSTTGALTSVSSSPSMSRSPFQKQIFVAHIISPAIVGVEFQTKRGRDMFMEKIKMKT